MKVVFPAILFVAMGLFASQADASTRSHYNRVDRAIVTEATELLDELGIDAGVQVRSTRGRLVIVGDLAGADRSALQAKLKKATGALTVVLSK